MRRTINFDDLAPPGGSTPVAQDYEGFAWVAFAAVDRDAPTGGDGVGNVVAEGSGRAAGTNAVGISAAFGADETFAFRKGVFASVRAEELTLTVTGFRDGVVVAERSFTLTEAAETLRFGRAFRDVDAVQFTPSDPNVNPFDPLADTFFAADDLVVVTADTAATTSLDPFG
ncbi:MAG: hypothetical protein K2X49_24475 [Acetobacteraceae bacterium]|nr:hypothetical protein [Acetobacteraceae bacterium]